jgi:hypothetical protein
MKKLLCAIGAMCMLASVTNGQNIPNNSFEIWSNNKNPDFWINEFSQPDSTIKKVSPGYSGSFAMQVKVYHDPGLNTDDFGYVTGRFPLSAASAPVSLTFFSRMNVVSGDSVRIILSLFNNGTMIGGAVGRYGVQSATPGYIFRQVPISYTSSQVPDSAEIVIMAGDADNAAQKNGTYIILDRIEFDGTNVSISESDKTSGTGKAYPNPAAEFICLPLPGMEKVSVIVTDIRGQEVLNIVSEDRMLRLPVAGFANGIYFYRIINENKPLIKDRFIINR